MEAVVNVVSKFTFCKCVWLAKTKSFGVTFAKSVFKDDMVFTSSADYLRIMSSMCQRLKN